MRRIAGRKSRRVKSSILSPVIKPLTARQAEFLALSARGMTYNQIAEKCCVTIDTVKATISKARNRLEAQTSLQCFSIAVAREELGIDHEGVAFIPIRNA